MAVSIQHPTPPAPPAPIQAVSGAKLATLAREYIQSLLEGERPGDRAETFGVYEDAVSTVEEVYTRTHGNKKKVEQALEAVARTQPALASVIAPPKEEQAPLMPELPRGVLLPSKLAQGLCPWFDETVDYLKQCSPRAHSSHTRGTALWILSTVAARRVCADYGNGAYTPLYVAIVAPSTVWGKTTTVKAGKTILKRAGLSFLLGSDSVTPEKQLSNMAGMVLPANYEEMDSEKQEEENRRLAFSGQVGWYYSEMGKLFQEMTDTKHRNQGLKKLLLTMDDGEDSFTNDTRTYGRETIDKPYIALIGTTTPADLKGSANTDSSIWEDGTMGRFLFACVPVGIKKTMQQLKQERFKKGGIPLPHSVIAPLQGWHQRLGLPEISISSAEKGKGRSKLTFERIKDLPVTQLPLTDKAEDSLNEYGDALDFMAQEAAMERFASCYGRLRDKCIRIAALVASFNNDPVIDIRHIAFAQQLTEEARTSLHELDRFLNQDQAVLEQDILRKVILEKLIKIDRPLTASEIRTQIRVLRDQYTPDSARAVLDSMVNDGILQLSKQRKKAYEIAVEM
jgi:hypothetical protein